MSLDLLCMFNLLENCMYGQPAEKIPSVRPGQFGYIVTTTVVHSITDISLSGFLTVIHRSAKRINSMRPLFGFDRLSISRFLYIRLNWNLTARCHETQCVLSSPILLRYGSPPRKTRTKGKREGHKQRWKALSEQRMEEIFIRGYSNQPGMGRPLLEKNVAVDMPI